MFDVPRFSERHNISDDVSRIGMLCKRVPTCAGRCFDYVGLETSRSGREKARLTPSSQRRLGPSPFHPLINPLEAETILAVPNPNATYGKRGLVSVCSGLGPSLRWDDGIILFLHLCERNHRTNIKTTPSPDTQLAAH